MKLHLIFAGAAMLSSLTAAQAARESRTTVHGKGADTSIRGGELSSRSFGNLDILRVRNSKNLVSSRKAYLRFDISDLPASIKTTTSAAISLTIGIAEGASPADKVWTFQVFGLKDGSPGEDWSEATTNWENAPGNDAKSPVAATEEATLLGTFTVTGKGEEGKIAVFNAAGLTDFLKLDTNGKATFIITRNEAGDAAEDNVVHIFASKENKLTAPTLTLGLGE